MAENFQIGGGNWRDSSRARFESRTTSSSSPLSGISFGRPMEVEDLDFKSRSSTSMNSMSASVSNNSVLFQDTQKLAQVRDLRLIDLGLSTHPMDWNQTLSLSGSEKAETRFWSGLHQNTSSATNFQQEIGIEPWRQKLNSSNLEANEYKQFSTNMISSGFQIDPAAYGSPSSTISSQGIVLGSEIHQQRPKFMYPGANYGLNNFGELSTSLSKIPQPTRYSPPKQQPNSQLLFPNNNALLWNATSASMNDVRSCSFFPPPTFDEKPKNKSEAPDLGKVTNKKSRSETSNKRSRTETSSSLPSFQVRKEKMGDRITALQQLVSPFGKTDTASVLSEAIEYIKFLHEQVNVLSNPYMKSGVMQHHPIEKSKSITHNESCTELPTYIEKNVQKSFDKSKDCKGPKQNMRSRGLCLVPVSSTFPITCETPVDFWTPTYGSTILR